MAKTLIVSSRVKEIAKDNDNFSVSGDFADELTKKTTSLIKESCKRAKSNNRHTIMPRDL